MPRRLRIKFPGGATQAPITLQAGTGLFTRTGQAATLSKTTPVIENDVWTELYSSTVSGSSPDNSQGWHVGCVIRTTGQFYFAHQWIGGGGSWFFDPVLGSWSQTNTNSTDWWKALARRENYGIAFDESRNAVWIGTGGPVGWGGAPGSPVYGLMKYDIATDTFYCQYPQSDNTYVPGVSDSSYFISANKGLGLPCFDHKLFYRAGYIYSIGGWSIGDSQNFRRLDPATNTRVTLSTYGVNLPPLNKTDARYTVARCSYDPRQDRLYLFADDGALYTYDFSATNPTWTLRPTTGTGPSVVPVGTDSGSTIGVWYVLDENTNNIVAWCGTAANASQPTANVYRKTWVLDLTTLEWRAGPEYTTATVPQAGYVTEGSADYDPVGKQILMARAVNHVMRMWSFKAGYSKPGIITSMALPTASGSTYGVNNYSAPFVTNYSCKHVEMAYCPLNGRLYAGLGDMISNSHKLSMWSMDLTNGTWRFEAGYDRLLLTENNWPYPFPNGFQDETLFQWVPNRAKFMIGFGISESYSNPPSLASTYAKGVWFFDPVTALTSPQTAFTQDTSLFNTFEYAGNNPQMKDQGYDEVTDTVYQIVGDTDNCYVKRWHIGTMTQLSTVTLGGTWFRQGPSIHYTPSLRNANLVAGRWVYALGTLTSHEGAVEFFFCRYNIDTGAVQRLSAPTRPNAVPQWPMPTLETRIGYSNGKIVWPVTAGPDGYIYTILVYNPATDTWTEDTQKPAYGNFCGNSVVSLPDGRVAMCGSTGFALTHMWFYKAL